MEQLIVVEADSNKFWKDIEILNIDFEDRGLVLAQRDVVLVIICLQ